MQIVLTLIIITITILGYIFNNQLIKTLKKQKQIQTINQYVLEAHQQKIGTPTMGGIIFVVLPFLFSIIGPLLAIYLGAEYFILILTLSTYAFIGFIDDFHKTVGAKNEGLTPLQKLILQTISAIIVVYTGLSLNVIDTKINLFNFQFEGGLIYLSLITLALVGFSNATNLTDGIDGLLGVNFLISIAALIILSFLNPGHIGTYYFLIILGCALAIFINKNWYPAQIFMGDTGSLSLGPILVVCAILLEADLAIIFFGLIYLLETFSVFIQVTYFKYTKKKYGIGRKIFLITPIHHHFEKKGWKEQKIVILFALINMIAASLFILIEWKIS